MFEVLVKLNLLVLITMLTTHCSPDSSTPWGENYLSLLKSSTSVIQSPTNSAPLSIGPQSYRLPLLRERALESIPSPPSLKMSALLAISHCEISRWIAHRNSPLGRVMLPSQKLLYEARFLTYAPDCQAQGEAAEALQIAIHHKQKYWITQLYELTWRGKALSKFFSTRWPSDHPPLAPTTRDHSTLLWFGQLATWPTTITTQTKEQRLASLRQLEDQLEPTLNTLSHYAGGRVLQEAYEVYISLNSWLGLIQNGQLTSLPCPKILNLMVLYQRIQPELSIRVQRLDQLSEATQVLIQHMPPVPSSMHEILYKGLSRSSHGLLQHIKDLSKRHAEILRPLFQGCLNPESSQSSEDESSPSSSSNAL